MLAEPRSRQKWSHDPRNVNWSSDKTKFGYQMLTKMGWSEGRGLGLNLSGNVSHIKVNKIGSNAGVGLKKSHDDDWIAHQDDFNTLLSALNANSSTSDTVLNAESKMKSSKKIRYTKFIKGKDLSNASSQDLACIFGQRAKPASVALHGSDDEDKLGSGETSTLNDDLNYIPEEDNIKTVDSSLSMDEYFAKKMEALRQKKFVGQSANNSEINDINNTNDNVDEACVIEKKKKKKRKVKNEESLPSECSEIELNSFSKSKEETELVLENCLLKQTKKKKKRERNIEDPSTHVEVVHNCVDDVSVRKKKKKKKKERIQPLGGDKLE